MSPMKMLTATRQRAPAGFTLIELLVVIAIISILASMLMPVYSRARESARKVVCSNQLHQLALAITLYNQDHDGGYPVAWTFWSSLSGLPTEPNLKTCIHIYVKNDAVWRCPSWTGRYGMNAWGGAPSGYDFIAPSANTYEVIGEPPSILNRAGSCWSEASLQSPSDYPLLFCGSHLTGSLNAHSGANDADFSAGSVVGGTNIAYADGHVKWAAFSAARWTEIYRTPR